MERTKTHEYQVILTEPAQESFFEILDYLSRNYSIERAIEVGDELRDKAYQLHSNPFRGTIEPRLIGRSHEYRFLLFRRTVRAGVKIIYFIEEMESFYN